MPNKTFLDFQQKTELASGDYIVGYKADGTSEFRAALTNLAQYVFDYTVPTYSLEAGSNSADEGTSVTFTLTTSFVRNGTVIPYTITGINAVDLESGTLTGNFVVNNNAASEVLALSADRFTESTETLILTLDGISPTVSAALVINDTSKKPLEPIIVPVEIEGISTNAWYFDGISSLSSTPKESLTFGLEPFTIEFWVNLDNYGGVDSFIYQHYAVVSGGANYFAVILANADNKLAVFDPEHNPVVFDDRQIPATAWTHCALVRNEDLSTTVFVNGTGVMQNPISYNFDRTDYVPIIGKNIQGYLANLKITKGTALYTTDFTPTVIDETPIVP